MITASDVRLPSLNLDENHQRIIRMSTTLMSELRMLQRRIHAEPAGGDKVKMQGLLNRALQSIDETIDQLSTPLAELWQPEADSPNKTPSPAIKAIMEHIQAQCDD